MKRVIFSVIMALVATGLAADGRSAAAAAEPEHPVPQSSRMIALEIVIGKIQGAITAEQAAQRLGPLEKVAAFVQELESSGRIRVVERIRLATLENQKTLVQAGKTAPVATAWTVNPRGGPGREVAGQQAASAATSRPHPGRALEVVEAVVPAWRAGCSEDGDRECGPEDRLFQGRRPTARGAQQSVRVHRASPSRLWPRGTGHG